ncbi:MAG: hypothetical protein OXC62_09550 [Aestuariivita sp.]|nr:hypothetical protein [Aestuariivita sp.]
MDEERSGRYEDIFQLAEIGELFNPANIPVSAIMGFDWIFATCSTFSAPSHDLHTF